MLQLKRSTQIATILAKYGFKDLVDGGCISDNVDVASSCKNKRPEKLRKMLEELGPTFIKFGQIMSTRPDVLGIEYIEELEKLQNQVEHLPYEEIETSVERTLDGKISEHFGSFEKEPLATASIAQVHRATLKNGTKVVVKVRKPGIGKIIDADLDIMRKLLHEVVKKKPDWSVHEPEELFLYFKELLEKELDFIVEAAHIQRFRDQHNEEDVLELPRIYRDLCFSEVMVMDFITGHSLHDLLEDWSSPLNKKDVGRVNAQLILEQIFAHGFFHGDPHPGNIYITDKDKICYLDFGLMGQLDRDSRVNMANLVYSIARKDERRVMESLIALTEWDEVPDRKALELDINDYLTKHFYQPLEHLKLGLVLQELLNRITRHQMRLPSSIYVMIKSLSTMEGWVKDLNPELDIISLAKPYVQKARLEQMNPVTMKENMLDSGASFLKLFEKLPREVDMVLSRFKKGEVKVLVEPSGLGDIEGLIDQIVTRLTSALIVAALIVGSSLIVQAKIAPTWHGVSIIGMAGFLLAAFGGGKIILTSIKRKDQ